MPQSSRQFSIANPYQVGTNPLIGTVWYPSTLYGTAQPLASGEHRIMVFAHGIGSPGSQYASMGWRLGEHTIVFALDTALFDPDTQLFDLIAMRTAIDLERQDPASWLYGAPMSYVWCGGHSVGGGNVMRAMRYQPGYSWGVAWAPVTGGGWPAQHGGHVTQPVLLIHGAADQAVPPSASAEWAQYLPNATYEPELLTDAADHNTPIHMFTGYEADFNTAMLTAELFPEDY